MSGCSHIDLTSESFFKEHRNRSFLANLDLFYPDSDLDLLLNPDQNTEPGCPRSESLK